MTFETTEIDPYIHCAECGVVFNGAQLPLTLTTAPQLVDMRRRIFVLTAIRILRHQPLVSACRRTSPPWSSRGAKSGCSRWDEVRGASEISGHHPMPPCLSSAE